MKEFFLYKPVSARRTLGGVPVQGFSEDFAYDPIGNRVSATDYDENGNPRTSLYTANALNQYVSRTVPGWASVRGMAATNAYIAVNGNEAFRAGGYCFGSGDFDNSANSCWAELETYATVNGPTNDFVSAVTNRVFVPQTPETFVYDADGNMVEDGRFRYFWNGENRMVRAEEKMPPEGRDAHVIVYAYDHQGRNVTKDGALQIWDEYNIIAENAGTENVTYNAWGLDIDGTMQGAGGVGGLLAVARSGATSLPLYDANGNITEYVDSLGGIESHTDYSAFGRGLMRNGVQNHSHGFSTKPWCRKSGLVEYQMRKYNVKYGRWLSRDHIDEAESMQLYLLLWNNPIDRIDLFGLKEVTVVSDYTCNGDVSAWEKQSDVTVIKNVSSVTELFSHLQNELRKNPADPITTLNVSGHGILSPHSGIMFNNATGFDLANPTPDVKNEIKNVLPKGATIKIWSCDAASTCEQRTGLEETAKELNITIEAKDGPVNAGPDKMGWLNDIIEDAVWKVKGLTPRKHWYKFP